MAAVGDLAVGSGFPRITELRLILPHRAPVESLLNTRTVRLVHPSERSGAAGAVGRVGGAAAAPLRKRTGVPDGCMQRARLPVGHIVPRWTRAAPTIEVAARSDGRMAGFAQAVRLLAVLTEHMQQDRAVAACHPASSAVPTRPDRILPHRLP